ncbi:WD40 repeat-like protein [Auriculariales sp. MPI-PUGE-AT-0066]|nr:WD40 repeat-like protein [Auriculariales sp. MPI-PUGE-AT-0066]
MRFVKPAWVQHHNEDKKQRLTICSVSVHPDGSRVATGGLDTKIRIWATKPIVNAESEESGRPPKQLATLAFHTGTVMSVRWSHTGKWLASGSDDSIIMIWDYDPNATGKVWGSDEVNVEGWKALKRLPGHDGDVLDLGWSPKDRYLASAGLDNSVIVWCGFSLERLFRLEGHQGFVKGVCWDPAGRFLATQSDDRTVKLWSTTDWKEVTTVSKPFKDSPGSTWFRRLTWSPDGAHVTASNAMNAGAVFTAAVITRDSWSTEISLVGHGDTVEAVSYNPHIFLRDPNQSLATNNICSVIALGAGDGSISVWQTKLPRPIMVGKDAFTQPILDLSWSNDGLTLYAVSFDGTMGVFDFDPSELEGSVPLEEAEQYLKKFCLDLPEDPMQAAPPVLYAAPVTSAPQSVNQLTARKGKKRAGLSVPSAAVAPLQPPASPAPPSDDPFANAPLLMPGSSSAHDMRFPSPTAHTRTFAPPVSVPAPDSAPSSQARHYPEDFTLDSADSRDRKRRRRESDVSMSIDGVRPRTLGGTDRQRPTDVVNNLKFQHPAPALHVSSSEPRLPLAQLQTYLRETVMGTNIELEAFNFEDPQRPSEVAWVQVSGQARAVQWLDFLPSPIQCMAVSQRFAAVNMRDGGVNIYSETGRRIMPTIMLPAPCALFASQGSFLLALTCVGEIYMWNVVTKQSVFTPHSILPFLSPGVSVVDTLVRDNGVPVLHLSSGVLLAYNAAMSCWTRVVEPWWSIGSDAVDRRRSGVQARGPVSELEGRMAGTVQPPEVTIEPGNKWWSAALTLGHLETRIHAAQVLESGSEWKNAVLQYAKRIADESFTAKAEELAKELCGPLYWKPGSQRDWTPNVLGYDKRDVLKDVLGIFAKSKALGKIAFEWQERLKQIAAQS